RGVEGAQGWSQADRRHQQGGPPRRAADRGDQRSVRSLCRARRQRGSARLPDPVRISQAGLDGRQPGRSAGRRHAAAVRPDPAPCRPAQGGGRAVPHDRHHPGSQSLSRPHHHRPHHLGRDQAEPAGQGALRRRQADRKRPPHQDPRLPRHRARAAGRSRSRRHRRHCRPHQGHRRRHLLRSR
ncbi:hypothetical protein KXV85_003512, partial [Aspergillus fumigatus]